MTISKSRVDNSHNCSERIVCALVLASNKETTGKMIFCVAMFYLDAIQDVVPTPYNKYGSLLTVIVKLDAVFSSPDMTTSFDLHRYC